MSAPASVRLEEAGRAPRVTSAPNFDALARLYRWMEWFSFGPLLSRCRRAFLPRLQEAESALVLGDGDGRFTAALLRCNRRVRVDAFDISPAMLEALRHRAVDDGDRVRTETHDLREWNPRPGARYDLVATHFFLDCLSTAEIQALANSIRPHLGPGALWVISEFAIPRNLFGRMVAKPLITFLYWAFWLMTGLTVRRLPDHHLALAQAGFMLLAQRPRLKGLLVSEIWSARSEVGRDRT